MKCRITEAADPRLVELIEKYGQSKGLEIYVDEKGTGIPYKEPSPEIESEPVFVPYEKAIVHLKGQLRLEQRRLDDLKSKTSVEDNLEKAKLHEHSRELKEKIEELENSQDLDTLINIANLQLDWVVSLFNKENFHPAELNEAKRVIELWYDIKTILYGEGVERDALDERVIEKFDALRARIDSEGITDRLFNINAEFLTKQAGYLSTSEFLKELYKLKDLDKGTEFGRWLGATGTKYLTVLDKMNRDAAVRVDQIMKSWSQRIKDVLAPIKKRGLESLLWQVDKDGNPTGNMTNRYSQTWYDARKAAYNALRKSITNPKSTTTSRNNAYKKLTKFLKDNTVTVDMRYFIDSKYESREGVTKEMHIEYLKEQFGEVRANEIIEQAAESYQKYLENLEIIKRLNEEKVETGELSSEQATMIVSEWVDKNSPIVWLEQQDAPIEGQTKKFTQSTFNRFVVNKPKKIIEGKKTEWYDANYERIENDKELLEAYNTIREFMDEMMSYLPQHIRSDIQANFLPRIKREFVLAMNAEGLKGAVAGYGEDFINSMTSTAGMENRFLEENEIGQLYKSIPTKFTSPIPVDERSRDLEKILPMFGTMALNYKYKSEVQDRTELAHKFLQSIAKSKQRKEYTTNELNNTLETIEWFMDSQLFEKTKMDEGVTSIKTFKGNTFEIVNQDKAEEIEKAFKKLRKSNDADTAVRLLKEMFGNDIKVMKVKERYKQLVEKRDEIEDKLYNDEITQDEYEKLIKPLEDEANGLGRNLVMSKVADKLMRYNQAMAFWFNPFSAFNNYMFGVLSNLTWAAGKTDFNPKQTIQAFGLMWKSALNLKDGKLDKATNLIAKFNLLYENLEYNSSDTQNETLKKLKAFPYVLLRKGDLFIKGQTMISIMLNKKVNVVENGIEKEISLWEAFDDSGEWNVERFGENKEWRGDWTNPEDNKAFLDFNRYVNKIEIKLHGNFDPNASPMYKKYVLTRMLAQFRASWMIEGIAQRFESRKFDDDLQREVEGRYRTFGKLGFKKSFQVLGKLVAGHFTGKVDLNNISAKDRNLVLENMRRNLMEIYLYAAMFSIYLLLKASIDDDDDNEDAKMALNMLNRVMADTTFYLSPKTFIEIVKDPIPILAIPIRATRGFNSALDLIFEDLTESEEEQKWRNITSNFYLINQYNKTVNMRNKVF